MRFFPLLPLLSIALVGGCAAQNLSRTLGRGNFDVHASVGGPTFTALGPAVPLPNLHVGARVGVHDRVDIDSNINLLALLYGNLALDVAANFQLYRKPGALALASTVRLMGLIDLNDAGGFRVFPELSLHAGGPIPGAEWLHLYGGVHGTFQFTPPRDKPWGFVTPFFGTEFRVRPRRRHKDAYRQRAHGLLAQISYLNPGADNLSVLGYVPGRGALAFHLGYRVQFGGLDR